MKHWKGTCRKVCSLQRNLVRLFLTVMLMTVSLSAVTAAAESGKTNYVKAQKTQKILFTSGSGKYLEKNGARYYLRSKNGKALTGIQYLNIPKTGKLHSGFYWFDEKGMLVQKKAVKYVRNQSAKGVTFDGYYLINENGRLQTNPQGICRLKGLKCGKRSFSGYYYVDKYGKLSNQPQVRYLKAKRENGVQFAAGYYYFDKYGKLKTGRHLQYITACSVRGVKLYGGYYYVDGKGRLHTERRIRTIDLKVGNTVLKGKYFFGGKTGKLIRKKGWSSLDGEKYYLDEWGKVYTNCWVDGYYVQADGTIARSKKLPDGTYVDANGRKCTQEEFEMKSLKQQLQNMIRGYSGGWSVYVKNLETGSTININDVSMYPASTIKAFVMASTYDQINKGNLQETASIRSLLWNMITVSDNESYNELVRRQTSSRNWISGTKTVNNYLKQNGYTKTGCHATLHPSGSSRQTDGQSNKASARDCGLLLERIYKGTCVNKTYSDKMLNLLLNQTRRWKIPSGVPSGVRVANKTGEISNMQHDMAIVFGEKTDYVICVFSGGCSEATGCSGIRAISSAVYRYLN